MYDAFDRALIIPALRRRRFDKTPRTGSFPASYGVRHGFRADVERPLPEGVPSPRRHPRVRMSFDVLVNGDWRGVSGDISAGGALILLPFRLATAEVEVRIPLPGYVWRGMGRVLGVHPRGERFAHHVQFRDPIKGEALASLLGAAGDSFEEV